MNKHLIFTALGCASAGMMMVSCQNSKGLGSATPDGGYPFDADGNYIEGAADGGSGWSNTGSSVASVPEYEPTPEVSSNTGYTAVNNTPTPQPSVSSYTPPAPVPSSNSSSNYTVKRGDSLWAISRKFGTSVGSIQSANGLSGSEIRIGQLLSIPGGSGGGGTAAVTTSSSSGGGASASGSTHTVRSGETLWGISRKYGVSVSALKNANGMSGDTLSIGKTLRIP